MKEIKSNPAKTSKEKTSQSKQLKGDGAQVSSTYKQALYYSFSIK